jgi:PEGA domain-containing protein
MVLGLVHGPAWAAPNPSENHTPARATATAKPSTPSPPPARAKPDPSGAAHAAPAATPPQPPSGSAKGAAHADKPAPDQVKKARDLWFRGVDAFRAGNYEEARIAFAECYQIMPKSDVLRNLSISEIQSGHYVSAARHLKQLLASPGDLPSNVRDEATNRLAQAEAQIGQLAIGVDVAGAEISIDGSVVGRSPLADNWYIEPGQHEILISKAGYPLESRQVFALAGVTIPVDVSLETLRREQAADAKAAELMGTQEGQDPVAMSDSNHISTASTVVLVTTGTLAAASLAAGIIFTVSANGHDSDADAMQEHLSSPYICQSDTMLPAECEALIDARNEAHTDRERAIVGFIGFGVASAVTLGYALWLTLDHDEPVSQTKAGVVPSVSLGRGEASINLHGSF